MRDNLKRARKEKNLTQQQMANTLGMSNVHQRKLREISENHHDIKDSQ